MKKIFIPFFAFVLGYFSNQSNEKVVYITAPPITHELPTSPKLIGRPITLDSSLTDLREQKSRLESTIEEYESQLQYYPDFYPFNFKDIDLPYGNSVLEQYNNNPIYFLSQPKALNSFLSLLADFNNGYISSANLFNTKIVKENNEDNIVYTISYQGHAHEYPYTNGAILTLTLSKNSVQTHLIPHMKMFPEIYYFSDNSSSLYSIGGVKVNQELLFHNFSQLELLK